MWSFKTPRGLCGYSNSDIATFYMAEFRKAVSWKTAEAGFETKYTKKRVLEVACD